MLGKLVMNYTFKENNEIKTETLKKGIYCLQIMGNTETKIIKFIKE